MSPNKRIFLNIVATYGRSLFAAAVGIFSSRWIFLAFGEVDFGLFAVVGSIIAFITFFNGVLGSSITRFYAYAIGEARKMDDESGRRHVCEWFNTALSVHTVVPLVLMLIGYPIGIYAIYHWLQIPPERVAACVWVFRISLVTAFAGMVSIPFVSLYTAYQDIVELSLYGVVNSVLVFMTSYWLMSVESDRLVVYALAMMLIHAGIPIIQVVRAFCKYRVCRIDFSAWWNGMRNKKLFSFAGWQFFGNCGAMMRAQACTMLTNVYFGPRLNAAYGISNTVLGQTGSLTNALIGAFTPAITSEEGAGDRCRMISYAWRSSRYGTYLLLLFLTPLSLEINEVLRLWLRNPPEWTSVLCLVAFIETVFNKMTVGQQLAIAAQGRIALYQATLGTIMIAAFPLAWVFILLGCGPVSVVVSLVATTTACSIGRIWFGWHQLGMRPVDWLREVALPLATVSFCAFAAGSTIRFLMAPSFLRVCATFMFSVGAIMVAGWFVVLGQAERDKIRIRMKL